ncbi:hypothetical protein KI659_17925 [Litoribacter alkaliphilus]|uniref:Uncharacterized protein n=1 Tax=Litoribacter ruber TaxID=702568 RepID=A0AAP2G2B4_9BACT|nr:hypothetical protein [Litoribacter alkaliphilus]MBS9525904.1 hypothetical protein [Litoribacter alkaliphilus]
MKYLNPATFIVLLTLNMVILSIASLGVFLGFLLLLSAVVNGVLAFHYIKVTVALEKLYEATKM